MGKTPKKAAPGGDERNLYVRRLKATTEPSRASESNFLPERHRDSEGLNRFVESISNSEIANSARVSLLDAKLFLSFFFIFFLSNFTSSRVYSIHSGARDRGLCSKLFHTLHLPTYLELVTCLPLYSSMSIGIYLCNPI